MQLQLLKDKLVRLQQSKSTTMLLELFEKEVLEKTDFHAGNDAGICQLARTLVVTSASFCFCATSMYVFDQ